MDWSEKVGKIFNTRPRIGVGNTLWLRRAHISNRLAETFERPGAHVCLDGPSGTGKTSLALTYLYTKGIKHAAIQVTEQLEWSNFCRHLLSKATSTETSVSGEVELGIENALPVAKFRISLGAKGSPAEDIAYLGKMASVKNPTASCGALWERELRPKVRTRGRFPPPSKLGGIQRRLL